MNDNSRCNYLEHRGIKGQKLGVRRYQNYNGSLTTRSGQARRNIGRDHGNKLTKAVAKMSNKQNDKRGMKTHRNFSKGVQSGKSAMKNLKSSLSAKVNDPNFQREVSNYRKKIKLRIKHTIELNMAIAMLDEMFSYRDNASEVRARASQTANAFVRR